MKFSQVTIDSDFELEQDEVPTLTWNLIYI